MKQLLTVHVEAGKDSSEVVALPSGGHDLVANLGEDDAIIDDGSDHQQVVLDEVVGQQLVSEAGNADRELLCQQFLSEFRFKERKKEGEIELISMKLRY